MKGSHYRRGKGERGESRSQSWRGNVVVVLFFVLCVCVCVSVLTPAKRCLTWK